MWKLGEITAQKSNNSFYQNISLPDEKFAMSQPGDFQRGHTIKFTVVSFCFRVKVIVFWHLLNQIRHS